MNILSLQPDFIVVDKEYGISSHASPGDTALNAVDILFQDTERRVAPITRLDRQTSGVMVFSDNPEFIQNVKFMEKTYYALCLGKTPAEGKIDQALTTDGKSQEALTLYKTITTPRTLSGVEVFSEIHATIMTGRHHQIRRHMRTLGHPVIGDYRHGYNDKNNELQEKLGFRLRCCLHAQTLIFMWKSKKYSFYSEIPADVAAIRDGLKALQ
jgi:tRNA pseudouridine65 synthase